VLAAVRNLMLARLLVASSLAVPAGRAAPNRAAGTSTRRPTGASTRRAPR